jgi:hypothetical protein
MPRQTDNLPEGAPMAHDVFISYASDDKPMADAVCAALEARRIRCWIAPRDVLPGQEYAAALVEAIYEAELMVLVFSSSANDSPHVMREVERAASKGIPIVPFRIEDVPPSTSMEYYISSTHWLDALTPPMQKHLRRLADTVERLSARLGQEVPKAGDHSTKGQPPTDDDLIGEATEATHAQGVTGRKPWCQRWIPYAAAAAVIIIALVVTLVLTMTGEGTATPDDVPETPRDGIGPVVASTTTTTEAPPDVLLGISDSGREVRLQVGDRVLIHLAATVAEKVTSVEWDYESLIVQHRDSGTREVSGFVTECWLELETLAKGQATLRAVYEGSNGKTRVPWVVYLVVAD